MCPFQDGTAGANCFHLPLVGWCAPLLRKRGPARSADPGADNGPRKSIVPGSYILLKGGDLTDELASLSEVDGSASVTVRSLGVAGAESQFTEKKVIIITP